jgi:hypothetical protein
MMNRTRRLSALRIAAVGLVCVALGACGKSSGKASSSTKPAATTTSSDTTGSGTTTTAVPAGENVWIRTAADHRGQNGERFTITCTPNGTPASIWGTETYTDDSSICTAAVHVGLITVADGGDVEYEIAAGLDEYKSGTANEVTSSRYGAFQGSFTFPDAPPGSGQFTLGAETWQRTANEYRQQPGKKVDIACAPGGPAGSVWGTDTYTDDSSICTAAVHAGLITVADGGNVTIEIAPGASSYQGTTANGITSQSYGAYQGSFTFPTDQPGNK